MSDQADFTYWECRDCGFDAVTIATIRVTPICPLCAGDNGRDVAMVARVAKSTDVVEGKDARK